MPHGIEQYEDGTAAFVSARTDAWHKLGTTLDSTFSAEQAMDTARLGGWNVRKTPLVAHVDTDEGTVPVNVPDKYATIRTHPVSGDPEALGVVGKYYQPIQNEEHCDLLNTLVDEGGAHFETAGSLKGGREVFVTMRLPQHITIGGVDRVDTYIAALNSHDGSAPFRLIVTPVRIVCANTQAAALRDAKYSYHIRHTASARSNLQQAREALRMTFNYMEEFQKHADKMIEAPLREVDFTNKVRKLLPQRSTATSKRAKETYEQKIYQLRQLFTGSETNDQIRGTRWAGYQAITEWLDHYAPVRAGEGADLARAEKTLTKTSVLNLKARAFTMFSV